jgi:hypothetical protein
MNIRRHILCAGLLIAAWPAVALAADYRCKVGARFDPENISSNEEIEKDQFSILIEEKGESAFLSRCSLGDPQMTCERYKVDKVVFNESPKITKFYVFDSQFDVQLYSDLSFVENKGNGGMSFGRCSTVAK